MNLVVIYGPPAVGKLTVAQSLMDQTGYKLLHNHLTVDMVMSIFEHGSAPYYKLQQKLRLTIIEEACLANLSGVIMTGVFRPSHLPALKQYEALLAQYDGQIFLVRLYANQEILEKRVTNKDRQQFGKIQTHEQLHMMLDTMKNPYEEISGRESISFDTGALSPEVVAQKIVEYYSLVKR